MRLRCRDGIVRNFAVSRCDGERLPNGKIQQGNYEARCLECGELFGVHDLHILKPMFRKHTCKINHSVEAKNE